jgi:hypothetical protein
MFGSILILFILPIIGSYKAKSSKFITLVQFIFWLFIGDVLLLMW